MTNNTNTSPALQRITSEDAIGQLKRRDNRMAALGSENGELKLDWVEGVARLLTDPDMLEEIEAEARNLWARGIRHIIWAGMGGSVLTVRVLTSLDFCHASSQETTPSATTEQITIYPLDSTDPAALNAIVQQIAAAKALRIPSQHQPPDPSFLHALLTDVLMIGVSMGMTSEEPITHLTWFADLLSQAQLPPAQHLMVMTLPGSYLDQFAQERRAPSLPLQPDKGTGTGGRMSAPATRVFLLPAALALLNASRPPASLRALMHRAWEIYNFELAIQHPTEHPFVQLAAAISDASLDGTCLLLIDTPPAWNALIPWLEQLMEESLGKGSKGMVVFKNQPLDTHPTHKDAFPYPVHSRGGGGEDAGRGPLRSPSSDKDDPSMTGLENTVREPSQFPSSDKDDLSLTELKDAGKRSSQLPSSLVVRVTTDNNHALPVQPNNPTFTLSQPYLAATDTSERLAALAASFLGWQLCMALFGYLQNITFAGQPAVENYKTRAHVLRMQQNPLSPLEQWSAQHTQGILTLYRPHGTISQSSGGSGDGGDSIANSFANLLRETYTAQRLAYLDGTINGEASPAFLAMFGQYLHHIGNQSLGIPVKLRRAPADYHSTEQSEMDGPPSLVSLRLLARQHDRSMIGHYDDTFLCAQAVSTWQAMLEQGRNCFLLVVDGTLEDAMGSLTQFFERVISVLKS